jgi:ADP-ribose pyrophosphatase
VSLPADQPHHWAVDRTSLEFDGAVVGVRRDHLVDPDGGFDREVVTHPGAVAVVAVDDEERVLVVQQYRHPVGARLVELPAGLLDVDGEEPLAAAKRELAEEGHVAAARWTPLFVVSPSPGMSTERVHMYLAEQISAEADLDGFTARHEEADMTRAWVPLAALVDAVLSGQVSNGLTIAGSLAVWRLRHGNHGLESVEAT